MNDEMMNEPTEKSSRRWTGRCILWTLMVAALLGGGVSLPAAAQDSTQTADLLLVAEDFTHPVVLTEPPDGSGRLFVVDQTGQIWIINPDGTRVNEPFLDISDRVVELNPNYDERGLLSLAFHPEYESNGKFYIYYSAPLREQAPDNFDHTNRLSQMMVSASDPNIAEPDSEKVLLEIDWPYFNHNGATLAFGPADSLLYLSLGDGGNRDDQDSDLIDGHVEDWYDVNDGGNGQDIENNLLGSILRIDVGKEGGGHHGGEQPYQIPEDNPFHDINGVPGEQWAYGFRNPFRMSFDMEGDHDLIVGDAGQDLYEEISVVTKGGNYGWNVMEGAHCFNAAAPTQPLDDCPQTVGAGHPLEGDPLIGPVVELKNAGYFEEEGVGLVVVGGHVYRGSALSGFDGTYVFGVASRGRQHTPEGEVHLPGRVLLAAPQEQGMWPWRELEIANVDSFPHFVLSFGQDNEGEVYVLTADKLGPTGNTGRVYRLVEAGSGTVGLAGADALDLPEGLALEQNYPNPFNPETTIRLKTGVADHVSLRIYDVLGREVTTLLDGHIMPGEHSFTWDGRDAAGRAVSSGVYVYRAESSMGSVIRRMILVK